MITVYTVSYNEELKLKFFIDHYRSRFPKCKIIIYDNLSTDNTVNIANNNDCEIVSFDTNNQFQDRKHMDIKNNCWKTSLTDWVLTCDVDELLDINEEQLKEEEFKESTIIKSEGYHMVNMEDNLDLLNMRYGARAPMHDKAYLFNKKFITDINYEAGCHVSNPIGTIKFSDSAYRAYHYHFVNENLSIEKYKLYASRLSPENIKNNWGYHYLYTIEQIRDSYSKIRSQAIKLL